MQSFKTFTLAFALLALTGQAQGQKRKVSRPRSSAAMTVSKRAAGLTESPANGPTMVLPKGTMPFVQKVDNGQVNWTGQYIEAEGEGILDAERFKNPAQARAMAVRGATVVAQRNLLEIVKGVNVTSETTVEDMIATKDLIVTKIDGVVKGAQMVGQPVITDGSIKVRLRMPLYAENGLAPAIYDDIPTPPSQPVQTDSAATANPGPKLATGPTPTKGFAFNMAGKEFDPALFPVITDKNGNVLLDTKLLYDPATGKFPQVLNATKQVLTALGYKKGLEILDVISAQDGKIKITDESASKFPWTKMVNTIKTVGKFLLMLI